MYDELIKALRNHRVCDDDKCKTCELMADAADAIEKLESQVPRWIPVTERLPVPRTSVLVAYRNGVTLAQLDGYVIDPVTKPHYWRGVHGPKHCLSSVTHWMPLPKAPDLT